MSINQSYLSDIEKILVNTDWKSKQRINSSSPRVNSKQPIQKRPSFRNTSSELKKQTIFNLSSNSPQIMQKMELYKAYHLHRSQFSSPKRSILSQSSQKSTRVTKKIDIPSKINLAVPYKVLQRALKKYTNQETNRQKFLFIPAVPKLPFGIHQQEKSPNFEKIKGHINEDLSLKRRISRIKRTSGRLKSRQAFSNKNSPINKRNYVQMEGKTRDHSKLLF